MNEIINNQEMKPIKRNLWKIWGILAILIIVGFSIGLFLSYESNKVYSQGYSAGLLYTANTGNIPYIDNSTGTPTIKEISLNTYCNSQEAEK